ncbi:MAG: KH domain-containing protein [Armatimonadia bacterium]|jgi:spoIIIJ-associated protein|nr:KH domain-containing protein [Armatimonadia bacterium]
MSKAETAGLGEEARKVVQQLVDLMGLAAMATVAEESDEQIIIDMAGADIGILIGRRGETLQALQLIAAALFHRETESDVRLIVDAEGYRDRRSDSLTEKAKQIADEVRSSGKEAVLDSLSAFERRVVHLALSEDPDIYTYSEGEGRERVLVISPKE